MSHRIIPRRQCPICKGERGIWIHNQEPNGFGSRWATCRRCDGMGDISGELIRVDQLPVPCWFRTNADHICTVVGYSFKANSVCVISNSGSIFVETIEQAYQRAAEYSADGKNWKSLEK